MRYLNGRIPACYCAPMICALAPFPTCSRPAHSARCHWYLRNDAGGSGHYFTTCSDGRLSFSVVTMVFAIRTVLVMTSVP